MEMRKCKNGHYYDASIHQECPYCTNNIGAGVTLPLANNEASATLPLVSGNDSENRTVALNNAINSADLDEGRTVALIKEEKGIDPVVGWIICIEGNEKGRDYRIHADNNFIGRSDRMDICIRGDETVSRDNHAVISYDTVDNTYYFSPGDGRAIVRLNEKALFQTAEIKAYDRITIGKSTFVFLPLCGKEFCW
ncbi:MAG: FHA domain-containing protein [Acetatifactor sp.]